MSVPQGWGSFKIKKRRPYQADNLFSPGTIDGMTKIAIVKVVSEQLNITQLAAKQVVQQVLDAIKDTLVEDRRIELRNFGVLEVRERAARQARNPKTGDKVLVEKKQVVVFKAGKVLAGAIQGKKQQRK